MIVREQPKHKGLLELTVSQQPHHWLSDLVTSFFYQIIHIFIFDMVTRLVGVETEVALVHTFIQHGETIYRNLEDTLSYFVIRPKPPNLPATQSSNLASYLIVSWGQHYLIVSVDSDGSVFQSFC